MAVALGRGGPYTAQGVGIMSRFIAVIACGFTLAACSINMPSLDFMKPAPQSEMLAIESEPPGAEAKTSLGQSCRTPCQLAVQPGSEFSVTLALSGYQLQTVSVRPEVQGAGAAPLAPNPVHASLQAVTPPKKPIAKKKKPVVAAARPTASPPVASATPTVAPAPAARAAPITPAPSGSAEAAPSATNYQWPSR
jgi:PEGA domain